MTVSRHQAPLALAVRLAVLRSMAQVHLANGHDVIMPQRMTNVNAGELAVFESAAAGAKPSTAKNG